MVAIPMTEINYMYIGTVNFNIDMSLNKPCENRSTDNWENDIIGD